MDDDDLINMDDMNMQNMSIKYDEDGNPIIVDKEPVEEIEPFPEVLNPLKLDQFRKYLSNLTKTFSGMSYAFTTFNCSEKEIDEMGNDLGRFIHLRDINISKNKIPLIRGFNNMTHLFRFDARENEIRDMIVFSDPEKFKFLQLLYLSNNKIKILPPLYSDNLVELHLDANQIRNASGFGIGLKSVKLISLNTNKLKDCSGFSNCPELEILRLNENEITSFKGGLENLPKLKTLEVNGNKFEKFDVIPHLPSLTKISIASNNIGDIKEFGKLKFPNIYEIVNQGNPSTNESGGGTKLEMVILFEGFNLKIVNEEEITPEDIKEAMDKKEERAKIAEEERIQREKEEAERLENERIRLEEEEKARREEEEKARQEEEERRQQELLDMQNMDVVDNNMNMEDDANNDNAEMDMADE